MSTNGKLISNDEIKRLFELIQSEDEEAERLTRRLHASYNLIFSMVRGLQSDKKRLEIYENDYQKYKDKYDKLKEKYDNLSKGNKKTIEENLELTRQILLLKDIIK